MGRDLAQTATTVDLAALFRDHAGGLAGAVRGVLGPGAETQEILQEACLRAWRHLRAPGRTAPADPVGWLFVVVMNTARDVRRKLGRRPHEIGIEDIPPMQSAVQRPSPSAQLAQREALQAAQSAIHALPEPEREVFLLRTSAELTFDAVASTLAIPVGTAKTRMRLALRRLRTALAAHAPEGAPSPTHPDQQLPRS